MEIINSVSIGSSLRKFYQILRLDKKDISAIYVFAIMAGVVQLSLPLGIQTIISFVMAGSVSTSIVVLILLVVFGTFLNGLLQVRQLEIIEKLKQKIFLRYGLEFSDRLPKLDNEKLDNYYLPELVNRFFDTISLQKGIIDIKAINTKYWKDENDLDLKRRKEAEFLVKNDIPRSAILGFAIFNEAAKIKLIALGIEEKQIVVKPAYYF